MIVNIAIIGRRRAAAVAFAAIVCAVSPYEAAAQSPASDTATASAKLGGDSAAARAHFYKRFAAGFAGSILLHESAHFASSYWMGFHPHLGFDKARPTVFSGIDESEHRRAQFIFSAAGLTVQDLLDEILLDVPHDRGGPVERGILAGGLATTLFYVTIGRNAPVSDISVMARNSHLSKGQVSLIFGSVAALHAFRMSRDRAYSHFFLAPDAGAGAKAGLSFSTR